MRRLKNIILVILSLALLTGCNSAERKLKKLNKQVEKYVAENQYSEAVDLYVSSLQDDIDHNTVIEGVKAVYRNWTEYQTSLDGTDRSAVFDILDDMIAKFPELQEYGEEEITRTASEFMSRNYKGDLKQFNRFWQDVIARYYRSNTICYGIDETYRTERRGVISEDVQALSRQEFFIEMLNKEYKETFDTYENSDLRSHILSLKNQIDFPVIETVGNKQFGIDFVGNFVVLYYGKFDDANKRTGDGIHMFFYKNSELALKSLVYGNFTDDLLNGDFEEYTIVDSEAWREGVVTGKMVDNKYDGEIKMTLTTAKSTTDYVMNFINGRAEAEGTYVDDDGNTIYVVASAWVGEKQRTYGYPEHFYELEHGLQPWHERAY